MTWTRTQDKKNLHSMDCIPRGIMGTDQVDEATKEAILEEGTNSPITCRRSYCNDKKLGNKELDKYLNYHHTTAEKLKTA